MYRKHVANFLFASSLALGLAPDAITSASAQPMPGGGMGGMGRGGGHSMQLRALGLSEAQQDQVFKIFHEQAPAMREQMKQVRDLLAPHHAHLMKYIDTWTVAELLP